MSVMQQARTRDDFHDEAQAFIQNELKQHKFVKWLRSQPEDTKLMCGNPKRCAIAKYLAEHENLPVWVKSLMVDSNSVQFFAFAKHIKHLEEDYPWYTSKGFSIYVDTDNWVEDFIEAFDNERADPYEFGTPTVACDLKKARTPSNTIKVLNKVLGRKFRVR